MSTLLYFLTLFSLFGIILSIAVTSLIDLFAFYGLRSRKWLERSESFKHIAQPLLITGVVFYSIGGIASASLSKTSSIFYLFILHSILLVLNSSWLATTIYPKVKERLQRGTQVSTVPKIWCQHILLHFAIIGSHYAIIFYLLKMSFSQLS